MSYPKIINKDFSRQTFEERDFVGYFKDCNFFGSVFERCTFNAFFYNCNFKNVTLDCPKVLRIQFDKTPLNGLNLTIDDEDKCEFTADNLARCHHIIAEIMRQKALQLPAGVREQALTAAELVRTNPHQCWKFFTKNIPKAVWAHSEFGFRDKGSILNRAIRARGKHFD